MGYSYTYDGQVGTLDYVMVNEKLLSMTTGAAEWNVNSDYPPAIDYNLEFGRDPEIFDSSLPYRFSDHDPILVGFDLRITSEAETLKHASGDGDCHCDGDVPHCSDPSKETSYDCIAKSDCHCDGDVPHCSDPSDEAMYDYYGSEDNLDSSSASKYIHFNVGMIIGVLHILLFCV